MSGSALLGHPPNTEDDQWIVRGFYRVSGIPDAAWNKTSIIPVMELPNAPHNSRETGLIVSSAVIITLATLITGTRLSLRLFRKDLRWGLDDWAIILGYLGVIAWVGVLLAAAIYGGAGKHLYDLTYAEFNTYLSMMLVGQTLFYPVVGMIKISIVLFNRRLTGLTSRKWMIFHNTLLCLLVIYMIITIFINVFIWVPHPKNSEILYAGKIQKAPHLMNSTAAVPSFSAIHIVFDFVLLSVPLIVLYQMRMNLSKKIRLCFLFSIGAVSTIGAVMRPIIQNHALQEPDITYDFPNFVRWSIIDIFFAITVASLPTLNNLIPNRWDQTSDDHTDFPTPKAIIGSERSDSESTIQDPHVQVLTSKGSETFTEKEVGNDRPSGNPGVGPQPDWDGYHPEIRVPV